VASWVARQFFLCLWLLSTTQYLNLRVVSCLKLSDVDRCTISAVCRGVWHFVALSLCPACRHLPVTLRLSKQASASPSVHETFLCGSEVISTSGPSTPQSSSARAQQQQRTRLPWPVPSQNICICTQSDRRYCAPSCTTTPRPGKELQMVPQSMRDGVQACELRRQVLEAENGEQKMRVEAKGW
jgi:hypothetical protein